METVKNKNPKLSSITERIFAGLAILAGFVGVFVVWFFNPTTAGFFPQCPLHSLSGLSCPGCGLTRGFHALFHGDILGALQFNLLLPVYLVFFGYLFVSLLLTTVRGRGLSFNQFTPVTVYGYFILAIAFAVLRNLPVYPFNLFAV
jgi:hypothetical protein